MIDHDVFLAAAFRVAEQAASNPGQQRTALRELAALVEDLSGFDFATWDPKKHPRWPKGHPKGGKFMTKDEIAEVAAAGGPEAIIARQEASKKAASKQIDDLRAGKGDPQELINALMGLTVAQMKDLAKEKKVNVGGSKADLAEQLKEAALTAALQPPAPPPEPTTDEIQAKSSAQHAAEMAAAAPKPMVDVRENARNFVKDYTREKTVGPGVKDLYEHLRKSNPGMTIGQYHDTLRQMIAEGQLRPSGWPRSVEDMPDSELALYMSHKMMSYMHPGPNIDNPLLPSTATAIPQQQLQDRMMQAVKGDMRFDELYDGVKKDYPTLTVGQFQDAVRALADSGKLQVSAWKGPIQEAPKPELFYNVSGKGMYIIKGGKPAIDDIQAKSSTREDAVSFMRLASGAFDADDDVLFDAFDAAESALLKNAPNASELYGKFRKLLADRGIVVKEPSASEKAEKQEYEKNATRYPRSNRGKFYG